MSTDSAVPPRTHVLSAWLFIVFFSGIFATLVLLDVVKFPLPPGGDPGHWLAASYPWVGLPTAPQRTLGSPLANYPLFLLILGLCVRAAGSPLGGAQLFLFLTLFFMGVSAGHLGWVLFRNPFFAPLLTALSLCNIPLFTLIFTGAYPNLLGFVFFNEAAAFLILFVRTLRTGDNLLFWGWASLLFLVHDLTFAVFVAFGVAFVILLAVFGRLRRRAIARAENVIGIGLLLLTVFGYFLLSARLGASHPGYFFGNPAAYNLAGLGAILNSFSLPAVPALVAFALLGGMALGSVLALVFVGLRWPAQLDITLIAVGSMVVGVATLPAFGYLLHIDTDYVRLGFFLVVPLFLSALVVAERILVGLAAQVLRLPPANLPPQERARRWRSVRRRDAAFDAVTVALVAVVAVGALVVVAIPTGSADEATFGSSASHGPGFVQAMDFLNRNATPGAVLAQVQNGVWVEALAKRDVFFYGPTYFQFYPFQVADMESAYFAYTQRYVESNNAAVVGYAPISNSSSTLVPTYLAFVQGVVFPILRVTPQNVRLELSTGHGGTSSVTASNLSEGPPVFAPNLPLEATTTFSGNGYRLLQTTDLAPRGGVAWLNYSFVSTGGVALSRLGVGFSSPAPAPGLVQFEPVGPARAAGNGSAFQWVTRGKLGLLPGQYSLVTNTTATAAATRWSAHGVVAAGNFSLAGVFPAGNHSTYGVSFRFDIPAASNPAVTFPAFFDTRTFLAENGIHFLLVPNGSDFRNTVALFRAQYGFSPIYSNRQFVIAAD